jgi:hypothetical protein
MAAAVAPIRQDLCEIAGRVRPFVAAGDRMLAVDGPLGSLLPGGGLRRGTTVTIDGALGAGGTSVALALAAAATATGEWAAFIDPYGTFGARAAAAAGVVLERCAVIRRCPVDRWSTVVAALLDGVALVAATVPLHVRLGDSRRLVARARERASVLVALGPWRGGASVRMYAEASTWSGLGGDGSGLLDARDLRVRVDARGAPVSAQLRALAG